MNYILLFMSCQANICLPIYGDPMESYERCEAIVKELPKKKYMKAFCVPVNKPK